MQCLDERAFVKLNPTRQGGSQVKEGIANTKENAIVTASDTTLIGDAYNRHDNYRQFVFDVAPCKPTEKIQCTGDPNELDKMELVIMYNSEFFDYQDFSERPVKGEMVIDHFELDHNKKYQINSKVTKGTITEQRTLF